VQFWHALERHIKQAIRTGHRVVLGALAFEYENATLCIRLPNKRSIVYPGARLEPGKFKDTTEVVFKDNERGAWRDKRAWYGIFVENVVSGVARDLLVAAMHRVEAAGYSIVLHVHDEIIAETREGFGSVEEFHRLLTVPPDWATGLPIAAKVRIGRRYSKSKPKPKPDATVGVDTEDKVYADDF
jgi:DNA polymerase